jgi:hypothetical protein
MENINSNYETGKKESAIIALLKSIVFLTPKKIRILQKKIFNYYI